MEEKKINQAESLAIITEMIARSNVRHNIGDGRIMLLWGYVTIGVSLLVWSLLHIFQAPAVNWLWFLIWVIGGIATPIMAQKQRTECGTKTYIDTISNGVWSIVGYIAIAMTFICLFFLLFENKSCWSAMFVFALLGVGFAETVQGVVIKENSMVFGGCVEIFMGLITVCCIAAHVTLYVDWFIPMFAMAFLFMMVIPGHIINTKARKEK